MKEILITAAAVAVLCAAGYGYLLRGKTAAAINPETIVDGIVQQVNVPARTLSVQKEDGIIAELNVSPEAAIELAGHRRTRSLVTLKKGESVLITMQGARVTNIQVNETRIAHKTRAHLRTERS